MMIEKNLSALKKINNDFEPVNIDKNKYITFIAKNNSKTIKLNINNKQIHLHSAYNPEVESEQFINTLYDKQDRIIIIFGLGFFYHIKETLKKLANTKFILFEPDINIFSEALRNLDLQDIILNQNVNIVMYNKNKDIKQQLIKYFDWKNIDDFNIYIMPGYNNIYHQVYKELIEALEQIYSVDKINQNGILNLAKKWQTNTIKNLDFIIDSYNGNKLISDLKKVINMPFIIVSAGPSLDECIEGLKRVKNNAYIVCVYSALKKLLDNNIAPDIVFSLDASQTMHEINLEQFNINLGFIPIVDTNLLKNHTGNKFAFMSDKDKFFVDHLGKYNKDYTILETSGTVSSTALSFAVNCGAKTVILVGQDFAYQENQTHAKGTYYDNVNLLDTIKDRLFYVDGYKGKVLTEPVFNSYRLYFENYFETYKNVLFINTSSKGAVIKNSVFLEFDDVITKYLDKEFEFKNIKPQKLFNLDEQNQIISDLKNIVDKTKQIISALEDNISNCYKLLLIYKNGATITNKTNSILKKLSDNDKLIAQIENKYEFFAYVYQHIIFDVYKNQADDEINIINQSLCFYETLKAELVAANNILQKEVYK